MKQVPPSRTGQTNDRRKKKIINAIKSGSIEDLRYTTIIDRFGGSYSTIRSILSELHSDGVISRVGKKYEYNERRRQA